MDGHLSAKARSLIKGLKAHSDPKNVEGMARFGINPRNTLGVSVVDIRKLAKGVEKDHRLALELWSSGMHEARILASLVDNPAEVTEKQMDSWAGEFDSWDVCDQVCGNLFDRTPFAYDKAVEWAGRDEEFVKRAGFALMAWLAVHDKKADDRKFLPFFKAIRSSSTDERNYVRKAVNWALRQMGKRSRALYTEAVKTAEAISRLDSRSARWVASDALKELRGETARKKAGL